MVKIARFLVIATLVTAPALGICAPAFAADSSPAAAESPAMPQSWDSKIPLPSGAVLIDSTVPKTGVVHSANFAVTQDYNELVSFYIKELPKAGFVLGPKLAAPARKVYDLSFIKGDMLDGVTISPSAKDPAKFNVHVAWTPDAATSSKPATP